MVVEPPALEIFKNHLGKHVRNDKSTTDAALGGEAGQMASRGPGPTAGGQEGISEWNKRQIRPLQISSSQETRPLLASTKEEFEPFKKKKKVLK